jgi:type II secretory pathway component PulJ
MNNVKAHRAARRGFSVVEVSVVSGLLVSLAMLLASSWIGLARPLLEATFQCRLAQEADLALAALARDLGGSLSDTAGRTGSKALSQFVGWTTPAGSQLWLCFDGGPNPNGIADWAPPDTVITYEVVSNSLVRSNQTAGGSFVVASNVSGLELQNLGGSVQITLTFQYRDVSQTYSLIANSP